ncbi:hypothetical protein DL769_001874 [Monosporascus sp. CRB-8-3]|nr:hypothetical protein DL769_001874 [Monosporascus sp. CRB-8-3]
MRIHTTLPPDLQEVDVIVAGGGTAGCIIASRLADADPKLSILVVESGRDNYNVPTVIHPVLWQGNYAPDDPRVFFHKAVKEEQLADRESLVQVGNTLGGGSSVSLMMYVRGQRCDYDSWNTRGWTADDLWPYLRKFETYHGLGKKEHHGYDGPIQVSGGPFRSVEAENDFITAMREVGYHEVEDLQDLQSVGVARILKYVSPQGQRQDVAHTYLHPRLQDGRHPNLHVLVESQVVRVIFDGSRRASGVEFRPNPAMQSNPVGGPGRRTVRARKLVVLSCGSLGTPPILERSGVGSQEILKRAGVPLIADLPGVGRDYQDHNLCLYVYKANLPPEATTDGVHTGQVDVPTLLASKEKILGWNGIDASSKIRPTSAEASELGSTFRDVWDRDFEGASSKPLVSMIFSAGLIGDRSRAPPGQYFSVGVYTAYPYSRGHEHITGRDLDDPLDFRTGYLSDKNGFDIKVQIWAYKKQREVVRRMATYRGEVSSQHPVFPPGSKAAYVLETAEDGTPLAPSALKNLEYAPEDDAAIEDWIRHNITTCWHGIGTCRMAPKEQQGVVDENLGVHDVHGLKVADLSIVPENICANTMSTALAIGEKAADIFIQELGLVRLSMSHHSWTLPGRAFARERSADDNLNQHPKFPNTYIGQPKARRQLNLSSVFSTISEKEENRENTAKHGGTRPAASGKGPLSSRTENTIYVSTSKTSHVTESQVNSLPDINNNQVDAVHSPQEVSSDTGLGRINIPFIPVPGVIGSFPYWRDDVLQETHHEDLLDREENNLREDIETEIQSIKPDTTIARVCSTSSSYPSEGIRSQSPGSNSPEPTASTEAFIADLVQYGSLHLSASLPQSGPFSQNSSSPDLGVGLSRAERLAAAGGIFENAGSRIASSEYGIDNVPPRETPGQPSNEPAQLEDMLTYCPNGRLGNSHKGLKAFLEHVCVQHVPGGPDTISPPPGSTVDHPAVEASRHSENSNEALQSNSPLARDSIRLRDAVEATTSAMTHRRSQDTVNTIDASQSLHSLHRVPNVNQASNAVTSLLARNPIPNAGAPLATRKRQIHKSKLKFKKGIKKVCKRFKIGFCRCEKPHKSKKGKEPVRSARAKEESTSHFWNRPQAVKKETRRKKKKARKATGHADAGADNGSAH